MSKKQKVLLEQNYSKDTIAEVFFHIKAIEFFLTLDGCFIFEATKKTDITYSHATKLSKKFIQIGFYIKKEKDKRTDIFHLTEEGERIRDYFLKGKGLMKFENKKTQN